MIYSYIYTGEIEPVQVHRVVKVDYPGASLLQVCRQIRQEAWAFHTNADLRLHVESTEHSSVIQYIRYPDAIRTVLFWSSGFWGIAWGLGWLSMPAAMRFLRQLPRLQVVEITNYCKRPVVPDDVKDALRNLWKEKLSHLIHTQRPDVRVEFPE